MSGQKSIAEVIKVKFNASIVCIDFNICTYICKKNLV